VYPLESSNLDRDPGSAPSTGLRYGGIVQRAAHCTGVVDDAYGPFSRGAYCLMKRQQIVIIGGGFGGLAAAQKLRNADADVTVIDRTNHHIFQPLLYQVATAALAPSDITAPIRWILRRQQNTAVLLGEVSSIDVDRKV